MITNVFKWFQFEYKKQKQLFCYSISICTNYKRKSKCDWKIQIVRNKLTAWREKMTDSLKFHFNTKKNDLNKKTDAKMSKQNNINQNSWIMNKSHTKMKNNKKQIMKNNVDKKKILRTKFINDWIIYWIIYQHQLTHLTPVQAEDLKKLKMK